MAEKDIEMLKQLSEECYKQLHGQSSFKGVSFLISDFFNQDKSQSIREIVNLSGGSLTYAFKKGVVMILPDNVSWVHKWNKPQYTETSTEQYIAHSHGNLYLRPKKIANVTPAKLLYAPAIKADTLANSINYLALIDFYVLTEQIRVNNIDWFLERGLPTDLKYKNNLFALAPIYNPDQLSIEFVSLSSSIMHSINVDAKKGESIFESNAKINKWESSISPQEEDAHQCENKIESGIPNHRQCGICNTSFADYKKHIKESKHIQNWNMEKIVLDEIGMIFESTAITIDKEKVDLKVCKSECKLTIKKECDLTFSTSTNSGMSHECIVKRKHSLAFPSKPIARKYKFK